MTRIVLDYPVGRNSLIFRLFFSGCVVLFYFYLAFKTTEELFHMGYMLSFACYAIFSLLYRRWRLKKALKVILVEGEYREIRRGGYYEVMYSFLLFITPLLFFLVMDPVFALGCLMGLASSFGLADFIFYLYVRSLEESLKGVFKAFIEPYKKKGRYVWGLTMD